MSPELFAEGGIRTLGASSSRFQAASYHNGSIWPHDNSMIAEGLEAFGFITEASLIRNCVFRAIAHFDSPVELYGFEGGEFLPIKEACRRQAWTAASLLADLSCERRAALV